MSSLAAKLSGTLALASALLPSWVMQARAQVAAPCPTPYYISRAFSIQSADFTGLKTFIFGNGDFVPKPSATNGYYVHDPAAPDPLDITRQYVWRNATVSAECEEDMDSEGNIFLYVLWTGGKTGLAYPLGYGTTGTGSCDYQLISDPTECTDSGTGSESGGGTGGGPTEGSYGSTACADFSLEPGCYDIYIDGVYDGRVCC